MLSIVSGSNESLRHSRVNRKSRWTTDEKQTLKLRVGNIPFFVLILMIRKNVMWVKDANYILSKKKKKKKSYLESINKKWTIKKCINKFINRALTQMWNNGLKYELIQSWFLLHDSPSQSHPRCMTWHQIHGVLKYSNYINQALSRQL